MKEVAMNRLTWVEYQGRVREERAPVFLPVGALEQHGPHLPLVTDALTAESIARAAVQRLGIGANVWVLPTLHYGKSTEHLGRAGTFAMSTARSAYPPPRETRYFSRTRRIYRTGGDQ